MESKGHLLKGSQLWPGQLSTALWLIPASCHWLKRAHKAMSSLETPTLQPAKFGWMTLTSRLDNLVMRAPQSFFIPTGGGGGVQEALRL